MADGGFRGADGGSRGTDGGAKAADDGARGADGATETDGMVSPGSSTSAGGTGFGRETSVGARALPENILSGLVAFRQINSAMATSLLAGLRTKYGW